MLVTIIFSFAHNIFYPIKNEFNVLSNILFVVCKYFPFGQAWNFVVWYRLNRFQNDKF